MKESDTLEEGMLIRDNYLLIGEIFFANSSAKWTSLKILLHQ